MVLKMLTVGDSLVVVPNLAASKSVCMCLKNEMTERRIQELLLRCCQKASYTGKCQLS